MMDDKEKREKNNARAKLNQAVKSGKIKRGVCIVCDDSEVEGHHPDYGKPLKVIWLCRFHHSLVHKKERDTKKAKRIAVALYMQGNSLRDVSELLKSFGIGKSHEWVRTAIRNCGT